MLSETTPTLTPFLSTDSSSKTNLPAVTLRCPICHRQAPVVDGHFGTHGRGRKGCSGSSTPTRRQPDFVFTCCLGTAAARKTSVTVKVQGVGPTLTYEFEGASHRERAQQFADALSVSVFSGLALLERLEALEKTTAGLRSIFQPRLSFCLAVLRKTPA